MYCNRQRLERFGSRRQREKRRRLGFQGQPEQYRLQFNSVRIFFFCKFSGRQWLEYEMLGKCIDCCSWCRQEDREEMGWDHPAGPAAEAPKLVEKQFWRNKKKICEVVFLQKRRKERDFALAENELFFLSVRLFSAFSVFVSHPHPRGASFWLQQTRLVVDDDVDGPTGGGRRRVAASCRFREREVCKNIAVSVLKIGECCRCCGCC